MRPVSLLRHHPWRAFPLQRARESHYGYLRLAAELDDAHAHPCNIARRERYLVAAERMRVLNVPCPRVYPRAWRRLAGDLPPRGGALIGAVLGLGLRLQSVCWPVAYLAACCVAWLAGGAAYGGAIVRRGAERADAAWDGLSAAPASPEPRALLDVQAGEEFRAVPGGAGCCRFATTGNEGGSGAWISGGYWERDEHERVAPLALLFQASQVRRRGSVDDIPLGGAAEEWLSQMKECLAALRFPDDLGQARAAIKYGSRFDWTRTPDDAVLPPPTEAIEGIAIVPHRGQIFVVSCGRGVAFLLSDRDVVPLALPQHRLSPTEVKRRETAEALWPSASTARALSAAAPSSATRPQVTCVPAGQRGRIVMATPGTMEALGAVAWRDLMVDLAALPAASAAAYAAARIAAAGLSTAFAVACVEIAADDTERNQT